MTYMSPSVRQVGFWGFHDGADIWKLRFMPDEIGRWQFDARFSDGGEVVSGAFDCVEADLPGMLSEDE